MLLVLSITMGSSVISAVGFRNECQLNVSSQVGENPLLLLEVEQLAVPPMTDEQMIHQLLIYSSVSEEVFQSYLRQAVPLT